MSVFEEQDLESEKVSVLYLQKAKESDLVSVLDLQKDLEKDLEKDLQESVLGLMLVWVLPKELQKLVEF